MRITLDACCAHPTNLSACVGFHVYSIYVKIIARECNANTKHQWRSVKTLVHAFARATLCMHWRRNVYESLCSNFWMKKHANGKYFYSNSCLNAAWLIAITSEGRIQCHLLFIIIRESVKKLSSLDFTRPRFLIL